MLMENLWSQKRIIKDKSEIQKDLIIGFDFIFSYNIFMNIVCQETLNIFNLTFWGNQKGIVDIVNVWACKNIKDS